MKKHYRPMSRRIHTLTKHAVFRARTRINEYPSYFEDMLSKKQYFYVGRISNAQRLVIKRYDRYVWVVATDDLTHIITTMFMGAQEYRNLCAANPSFQKWSGG